MARDEDETDTVGAVSRLIKKLKHQTQKNNGLKREIRRL